MDKEHYTIHPLEGFGLLRFGQSVAEAKTFANIYGQIEAETLPMTEEYLRDRDEYFRELGFPEDEIAQSREIYIKSRKDMYTFTFKRNVILFFNKDRLYDIRLSRADFPAYLGDEDLFSLYGRSLVHYVAQYFNENPYLWEKAVFFLKPCLSFDNCFDRIENGQVVWRGSSLHKGDRGIFLGPESAEPHFDYTDTVLYKALP